MALTVDDIRLAGAQLLDTLRSLEEEGLRVASDDPLALKYEDAIEQLWNDLTVESREALSQAFVRTFGFARSGRVARREDRTSFKHIVGSGWFGDYLEYTAPGKSTPQFFFGAALAFIAAGFGRAPKIEWEVVPLYPNLYILLVGGTGAGKGAAVHRAQTVVQPVLGANLLPNEGSHQGYAEHLKRRWELTGTAADGLIVAEEFRVLLSEEKHKRECVAWFTQWYQWDGWWERALRGEPEYRIFNPCVSILGASNMTWLRMVPSDAILGGFFPRFLTLLTPEEEEPWGVSSPKFDEDLLLRLQRQLATVVVPDTLPLTREAEDWMEDWYQGPHKQQSAGARDERVAGWMSRKQATMMKIAAIRHLVEHHDGGLCAVCMQWSRRLLDWTDVDVEDLYAQLGVTKASEILEDVLRFVRKSKGAAVDGAIRRGLRNKYRASQVRDAIDELAREGDLVAGGTGPRGTKWKLAN